MVVAFQFQGSEEHWTNDGMQPLAIYCIYTEFFSKKPRIFLQILIKKP
jgi:hypothetical protein